ncbi:uncharacterized protein MKZ38_001142 [Zalerion maritima]|uniref:Uncharacterized protein n=1 Tax=Zalerion maritima TaxID=339359 RepID=A0AAD5RYB8_9PEZI|nr:uncharacterized protein MKZ38_001142 [Zalerion maritima]
MSRNIKIKKAATASRSAPKRRASGTSTPNLSSDSEGYSALDEVSDSDDDDDEDVTAAEEKHLINRAIQNGKSRSPRPPDASDDDDVEEDDEEGSVDNSDPTADDADAEDGGDFDPDFDDFDNTSWNGFMTDLEEQDPTALLATNPQKTPTTERRVRFAEGTRLPSSETSTDTDSDVVAQFFPDVLDDTGIPLHHVFRREDLGHNIEVSSNDSYGDFNSMSFSAAIFVDEMNLSTLPQLPDFLSATEDETSGATPQAGSIHNALPLDSPLQGDLEFDDNGSDSTDTDEEAPLVLQKIREAKALQQATQQVSNTCGNTTSAESTDTDSKAIDTPVVEHMTKRNGKPRSAKLQIDQNGDRAVMVYDPKKKRMVRLTPKTVQAMDEKEADGENAQPFYELPDLPANFNLADFDMGLLSSPPGPDVMLNGLNNGISHILSSSGAGQVGTSETFFNTMSPNLGFGDWEFSSDDLPSEYDEAEANLQVDAFFQFGDETDNDGIPTPTLASPLNVEPEDPFSNSPLNHLQNNANAVGAFRINQENQNLISSRKATEESLDFSGPFNTPIRGVKSGRLDAASTSISPVRRQKRPSVDIATTPVAGRKRGSVSENVGNAHKRQRSISEVGRMQI